MCLQVDVFFGPCCDYAAAPVGRQLHYWQLPMLTAGAIARDFAAGKRMFFDLITRVGTSVNSLLDFLLEVSRVHGASHHRNGGDNSGVGDDDNDDDESSSHHRNGGDNARVGEDDDDEDDESIIMMMMSDDDDNDDEEDL